MSRRPETTSLARRVFAGAAWTVASTLLLRVGNIAIMALVARLLAPSQFGVFAVALAVYVVVSSLAELGMGSAIAKAPDEPADIAPTVTALAITISATLAVAMAAAADPLASALGSPDAAGPIRVLSLSLLLTGIFAVPGAQLVREYRQDKLFLATVAGFLPANAVLVGLALSGGGATSFAWSRVVGQLIVGLVVVASLRHRYRPGLNPRLVPGLLAFGLPLALANLLNWALLNADYLIVARFLSEADVGVYMLAFSVAGWSTAVLGSVLNSLVVPTFARFQAASGSIRGALSASIGVIALVSLPIGTVTFALAGPLMSTLFGPQWSASIPVLRILVLYGVMFSFSLLLVNALVATARTTALLVVQILWICVLVPVMTWSVRWGVEGVAWAHVVVIAVVVLPAYVVALRPQDRARWRDVVRELSAPAVAAVAGGLAAGATAVALPADWLRFLFGGTAGFLTFAAIMVGPLRSRLPEFARERLASGSVAAARQRLLLVAQRIAARLPSSVRHVISVALPSSLRRVPVRSIEDWSTPLVGGGELTAALFAPGAGEPARQARRADGLGVLVMTGSLDVGGMDAFVAFLARGLDAKGMHVSVVVTSEDPGVAGRLADQLRAEGHLVLVTDQAGVDETIGRLRADVVSVHGAPDWAVRAAAAKGLPVVETLHGMHTIFDAAPDALVTRSSDLTSIVAVSDLVREQFLAAVPSFPPSRALTVPNGVQSRARANAARADVRRALGLTDEFLYLSLARHCLQKNTYGLVTAFEEVAELVPGSLLVIAGRPDDPGYFAQVADRVRSSPWEARIRLRDHLADPAPLLAAADAFVLDSFFEGWSLASMEALTCGLPVVLSDVGGAREQLSGSVPAGHLVANPLGDPLAVDWKSISGHRFRPQVNRKELVSSMVSVASDRGAWALRRADIAAEAQRRFAPEVCLQRHAEVLLGAADDRWSSGPPRRMPDTQLAAMSDGGIRRGP